MDPGRSLSVVAQWVRIYDSPDVGSEDVLAGRSKACLIVGLCPGSEFLRRTISYHGTSYVTDSKQTCLRFNSVEKRSSRYQKLFTLRARDFWISIPPTVQYCRCLHIIITALLLDWTTGTWNFWPEGLNPLSLVPSTSDFCPITSSAIDVITPSIGHSPQLLQFKNRYSSEYQHRTMAWNITSAHAPRGTS